MGSKKIIVLDDDPTGIQTVHDVLVITNITFESILEAMESEIELFYLLTNSRSFTQDKTTRIHREIVDFIVSAARRAQVEFTIISRSDSTLRGHYPLETEVIRDRLEFYGIQIDGEILCPFLAGIRRTEGDIHYVLDHGEAIPCALTDYARDKSFAYTKSDLKEYVEEKTQGRYRAKDCVSISIDELRNHRTEEIKSKLREVHDFNKVIVNAVHMEDLDSFILALEEVLSEKNFLFRTAASFVKAIGHIGDRPLLTREECIDQDSGRGGLILVGSHVEKTSAQLSCLKDSSLPLSWVEFDQHRTLDGTLHEESLRVSKALEEELKKDRIVVVATRRERVDSPGDDPEKQLEMATEISEELTGALGRLTQRPRFLITKGGITSSDTLNKSLHMSRGWVLGQIKPAIGVIKCGKKSKFEGLPVVIFPGNVGDDTTLRDIVEILK